MKSPRNFDGPSRRAPDESAALRYKTAPMTAHTADRDRMSRVLARFMEDEESETDDEYEPPGELDEGKGAFLLDHM